MLADVFFHPFELSYLDTKILEPAVHRMGAPTGWLRSYLDLWPKILSGILPSVPIWSRAVDSGEPLGSILAGPSPKLPVRN